MSRPLDVAFVWHMHQPYYRSATSGGFSMPWVRMHAIKDYLDMVEMLGDYPSLHQTFNLVPSLVEQLEDYSSSTSRDVYWEYALKPAAELEPAEKAFLLERMCDHTDHPRPRSHPRYLELARKRESLAGRGWEEAARGFTPQELLDLQIWFDLAWFGNRARSDPALSDLVERGRDFREDDKRVLHDRQREIIAEVLPAYKDAEVRGQIELTTSPYFHPILPLLCDTDSARIASPDLRLPPRRFAHPEDALEQLRAATGKHEEVFGETPRGVWCSEMAAGESVIPLLTDVGFDWTISDEEVLARSLSGTSGRLSGDAAAGFGTHYVPYRLERETGGLSIVFRDHTLSDLIGFTYRSWDSADAAADLISRLRDVSRKTRHGHRSPAPLVVVALDGENAWEYYPNDGHDFLAYLYEGLSADDSLRCVTVSERLSQSPARHHLDWLHTGSWISADLTTWCGTDAHSAAWEQLHQARDLVQQRRAASGHEGHATSEHGRRPMREASDATEDPLESAWRHVQIAEGSDWFWWFGEHHHTDLDSVWDLEFRTRLQEVYRVLGETAPPALSTPLAEAAPAVARTTPSGPVEPEIDGVLSRPEEWDPAGSLVPVATPAMQPSVAVQVHEVRYGWQEQRLCVLAMIDRTSLGPGVWLELASLVDSQRERTVARVTLQEDGSAEVVPLRGGLPVDDVVLAWKDVVEMSLPATSLAAQGEELEGLVVRIGAGDVTADEFRSSGALALGTGSP